MRRMQQMKRFQNAWPVAVVALVVLALASTPAAAGDQVMVKHKKIQIKRIGHDCDADDCPEVKHERRMIMIGADGEVHKVGGDDMQWVGHDGVHVVSMGHHGKGGFLGVAATELTPELRSHFGVPEEAGVLVAKVVDDSAAARAGVQVGDILTAVAGGAIGSSDDLIRAIGELEPGSAVDLELWRDGTLQTLGATLGERQQPKHHAMVMHCDDNEDCPQITAIEEFDCGDDSDCEIRIECKEAGCDCTVNGESAECETLPGFVAPGE
jgi:S1-C subfamily serine protease